MDMQHNRKERQMKDKEREPLALPEDEQEELVRRLLKLSGGRPAVPEEVADRVRESVHSHWKQSVRARSRKRFAFLFTAAIAASLLIFFLANYVEEAILPKPVRVAVIENQIGSVVLDEDQLISRGTALFAGSTLESGLLGRALVRTAQDVTMRLDVNTRVRFSSESSFVLEQGAIYLDSGPAHQRFHVTTPMGDVSNQGTQFEIRLRESKMEVRVREGSVSLTNKKLSQAVTAGNRLTVNAGGNVVITEFAPYGPAWEWITHISPSFDLEGRTLTDFLGWIVHENGWRLNAASQIDQSHGKIVLHGSVEHLSPAQMLEAVLPVCGLSYILNAGVLTVYPAEKK
jgi:hypothetical protein